jgi:hypothetical protein
MEKYTKEQALKLVKDRPAEYSCIQVGHDMNDGTILIRIHNIGEMSEYRPEDKSLVIKLPADVAQALIIELGTIVEFHKNVLNVMKEIVKDVASPSESN